MTCFLFIFEVKILEHSHLDLPVASKLHNNYIAVNFRQGQHVSCLLWSSNSDLFHSQSQNKYGIPGLLFALQLCGIHFLVM